MARTRNANDNLATAFSYYLLPFLECRLMNAKLSVLLGRHTDGWG